MSSNPPAFPAASQTPTQSVLPSGWNKKWLTAKAAAAGGTGTAKIVIIGDSWAAGQSTGTVTDCLLFGWVGRLDSLLAPALGGYAEGYMFSGVNNVTSGGLVSPSGPYSPTASAVVTADGGVGQTWGTAATGSTFQTITAKLHPVTGAIPLSMDLYSVDFNNNAWQYSVDGGGAITITAANGTPPNGVNGTVGAGMLRRTNITWSPGGTHTVAIQQNAANALALVGHTVYYGTTGLGIWRGCIPGSKAVDFATGGGATASNNGGNSLTPDHIVPYAGLSSATTPAVNNIFSTVPGGFPFSGTDLAIILLGGNDCTQGGSTEGMRQALTRFINAFRRLDPAGATTPPCSILFLGEAYSSEYSDNPAAAAATQPQWQRYKDVIRGLAQSYGCGWLDLQQVFGETPVARGLVALNGAHPTQNGAGAGGGDGHLTIAQAIYGIL